MNEPKPGYPPEKLIFLLGIMPRSGTNYLFDLLLAHRGTTASQMPEDNIVNYSNYLDAFVHSILRDTNPAWGTDETRMYQGLRLGLVSLLADPAEERRIVAKTPSVTNLHKFFKLFPTSKLVILVRDGRAVAESTVRSFKNWTLDMAARRWAAAADQIIQFSKEQAARQSQFLVLRYEDLYMHQTEELKRVYEFLDLDPSVIDFDALLNIPVRGSSTLRGESGDKVHWKPVAKTEAFKPLERYAHWTPAQHARFNRLAGKQLQALGYDLSAVPGSPTYWGLYNRWKDMQDGSQAWGAFLRRQVNRLRR